MAEYINKQKLLKEFDKRYCDQCDDWEGLRCRQCEINQAIGIVEIARTAEQGQGEKARQYLDFEIEAIEEGEEDETTT